MADARTLSVPDGLEGERRRRRARAPVRPLPHQGRRPGRRPAPCQLDQRSGRQVRPASCAGDVARGARCPTAAAATPRAGRRAGARACGSSTTTTTSSWSTSRSASPPTRASGWTGPTVVGGLAAAGYRIATCGARERQGIVHRLDVGTSGPDGRRQERARLLRAQARLQGAHGRQDLPRARAGPARPARRHHRRPDRPAPRARLQVRGAWPTASRSVTHYETLEAFRAASLLEVHLETGRTHQIRVHLAALRHPCVGDLTYGADPTLAARLGLSGSGCTPSASASSTPARASRSPFESPYPADLQTALDRL